MDKYQIFISHATKDKASYVENLVEAIKKQGIKVFYDSESIAWGDHIPAKVEEGLSNCTFAVVVISKNFIGRSWTEYELRTLLARQDRERRKLILPILHNISKKQFVKHYPELVSIKYLYSKQCSCDKMAELIKGELEKREKCN